MEELELEGTEQTGDAENQEARPSIEEAIALAMEKHSSAQSDDVEPVSDNRPRDAAGRFAPAQAKEGVTDSSPQPQTDSAPTDAPQVGQQSSAPNLAPINPPHSWSSAEAKATFATLPRHIQEEVARREYERDSGLQRKFEEVAEAKQFRAHLEPVFQRYGSVIQQTGLPPAQLVEELLKSHATLLSNPKYGVAMLAKNLGITPEDLTDPGSTQLSFDPRIDALEERLRTYEAKEQERISAQQAHQHQMLVSTVEAFAYEKAQDGRPLRPHFEKVYPLMKPITQALVEQRPGVDHRIILQDAYDQAVYAHPETRQMLLTQQAEELAAKRQAEAAEKAAAARKAGVSIKGGLGGPAQKAAPKSVEAAVLRAMEIHR